MTTRGEQVREIVQSVRIIDTHEHVYPPNVIEKANRSIFDLIQGMYLKDDLTSAGYKDEYWNKDLRPVEKWEKLKTYLACVKNTTYYSVLAIIFRDLYGVKEDILTLDWTTLSNHTQRSAANGSDWYDHVLKKSGIELCLLDKGQTTDFEIGIWRTVNPKSNYSKISPEKANYHSFLPVLRVDLFAYAYKSGAIEAIHEKFGTKVSTFNEFEEFLTQLMAGLRQRGFYGIKSTLAYSRDLCHASPDREKAARAWIARDEARSEDQRAFQDYVVSFLSRLAAENGVTFAIHTGLRCFGAAYTPRTGPHELIQLINTNPETKYDLFHAGYPWIAQAAAMAKSIPNVHLNLNWLPVISQELAQRYFSEVLDTVPVNKISWGGDCAYIEEVYAHSRIMRDLMASVLAQKVDSGRYGTDLSKDIADRVLRNNAIGLYQLQAEPA